VQTLQEMLIAGNASSSASVLDIIVDQGRIAKDPAQSDKAVDLLARFLDEAPAFGAYPAATAATLIAGRVAEIDKMISAQVNEILHANELQRLEASWRGLRRLVRESSTGADVRVKVMPVAKKELLKDFERATGFDQSALFKRIYEEEFGTLVVPRLGSWSLTLSLAAPRRTCDCCRNYRMSRQALTPQCSLPSRLLCSTWIPSST
jgi:predicted component of type VI protein secretion system